ncbi:lycopene beta-cyclase CrtY [Sphingomonas morindae]|uniref:Lycopene beta-cyclase CrtY n=1 Tax=Sphingomonas morindae TaxID=1541170 RepID=A0ABY4XBT9_9SPHN|nr:lycopene beta-cyclase CrtY [Sphingomonas morindae]USI74363.1 lycopene beta-cyclase CrtY [Sphingomonas morindae]
MAHDRRFDLAIVGGGLAGGLIALAVRRHRPEARIALIEAGARCGGNHIWSFFDSDIAPAHRPLVAPLAQHRWPGYDIAFPAHRRRLETGYNSIASEALDAALAAALPLEARLLGRAASAVTPTEVRLEDGTRLAATGVIDARGPGPSAALELGWQKFLGQTLRLSAPHGLARPIVMDATVPQIDGYRFVYVLPLAPDQLFVEDTYYSDTPALDVPALAERIAAYAAARGWRVAGVAREETGALPVVLAGDFAAYWNAGGAGVAKAGLRAGLFHPTTGYSLPDAVRTAHLVAGLADWSGPALHAALHRHAAAQWRARGFYRLLDRMLFRAAEPAARYKVLERFYRLDPALIGRFYAARSTWADKARIVAGRPPVPLGRAMAAAAGARGASARA